MEAGDAPFKMSFLMYFPFLILVLLVKTKVKSIEFWVTLQLKFYNEFSNYKSSWLRIFCSIELAKATFQKKGILAPDFMAFFFYYYSLTVNSSYEPFISASVNTRPCIIFSICRYYKLYLFINLWVSLEKTFARFTNFFIFLLRKFLNLILDWP